MATHQHAPQNGPQAPPGGEDVSRDAEALGALREGLRSYFAALGPEEGRAFDALLADGSDPARPATPSTGEG